MGQWVIKIKHSNGEVNEMDQHEVKEFLLGIYKQHRENVKGELPSSYIDNMIEIYADVVMGQWGITKKFTMLDTIGTTDLSLTELSSDALNQWKDYLHTIPVLLFVTLPTHVGTSTEETYRSWMTTHQDEIRIVNKIDLNREAYMAGMVNNLYSDKGCRADCLLECIENKVIYGELSEHLYLDAESIEPQLSDINKGRDFLKYFEVSDESFGHLHPKHVGHYMGKKYDKALMSRVLSRWGWNAAMESCVYRDIMGAPKAGQC